jgi:hypothetical protein
MAKQEIKRYHPQAPKELDRYLVPTETIIFMHRLHVLSLFGPVAITVTGLIALGFLAGALGGQATVLLNIAALVWLGTFGWLLWKILDWSRKRFLATDRRLLLLEGIITRKVSMMPLSKVTDMRYDRTVPGKLLGYGVFVLESAGQDQALNRVPFVPDPDQHYQELSAVLFAPAQRRLSDKLVPASTGSKLPISEPEQAWWKR